MYSLLLSTGFSLYIFHEFHPGEILLAQTLPYVQLGTEGVEHKTVRHTTCCFMSSSKVPVSVFSVSSYNGKHQESRSLPKRHSKADIIKSSFISMPSSLPVCKVSGTKQ